MTPAEKLPRIAAIQTLIRWLRIRRENTSILVEALGLPSAERLDELISEEIFPGVTDSVLECISKELGFLADEKFPGLISTEVSAEEIGLPPSGATIN